MRLLQTQDVARRLGVATSTIRRWAAEGRISYLWAGSYRVFEPDEVRRLAKKLGERAVERRRGPGRTDVNLTRSAGPTDSTSSLQTLSGEPDASPDLRTPQ